MEETLCMINDQLGDTKIVKISSTQRHVEKLKENKWILNFLDSILATCVVGPLVICFWRGIWDWIIIYEDYFPLVQTIIFSWLVQICIVLSREVMQDFYDDLCKKKKNVLLAFAIRNLYSYAFLVICVINWRGIWDLFDAYLELELTDLTGTVIDGNLTALFAISGISFLILAYTRTLVNMVDAPFCIEIDKDQDTFQFPTRFNTKMTQKTSLYILDCLFSVLIVGTLVVFVWRGAWALIDIFLFPEDEYLSAFGSLIIGYAVVLVSFLLQTPMKWICDRLEGGPRLFAADIFLCFSLLGTVNVWRGIWNLLNLYFLPDNLELSCWITHWVSLVLLILMGCSNSLLVRGVYIDAEEPAGKCVIFPCYYLRLIFQQEREKKLQLDLMSKRKQELDISISGKLAEGNHVININQFTEPNHHADV